MRTNLALFRTWTKFLICCIPFFLLRAAPAADFQEELIQASTALQSIQERLEEQLHEGKLAQANQQLLNAFPKAKRTPAETLALGNMFYGLDARLSYALHKDVAQQLPNEPLVLLEWAMEQHRAGEYAGALAAYDKYSKAHREFAPAHGLAADCLIRLGRTSEASARWHESEKAKGGSLETFESLVCEIYRDPSLEQRRVDLRSKAKRGDVDAAVRLIALDGKYERDWWNNGPNREHLAHDLPLLQKLLPNPRIKAALCLGECLMKPEPTKQDIRAILNRYGYLIDPKKTLPSDGMTLSLMLGTAVDAEVLTSKQARQQFGETLRVTAKTSKDSSLLNVISYLFIDTEVMADIEMQAWEATNDPRFAAGYFAERLKQKSLETNDPLLVKALKQFPEDSSVLAVVLAMTGSPSEELLVQAIKAEYRHFSGSGLILRPSARPLRKYFEELARVLAKAQKLKTNKAVQQAEAR